MNDSLPLEVKGITIHNTGTTESASELRDNMKKSGQLYLCHYIVDEENSKALVLRIGHAFMDWEKYLKDK